MKRLIAGTINRYPAEDGWENVHLDKSSRRLHDLEDNRAGGPADLVMGLEELGDHPELAGLFDEVRCWQVLEHLTQDDARRALAGFRHVLKPGGILDVEVPDIEGVIIAWIHGDLTRDDALANLYGQSTNLPDDHLNAHRWGYTPLSLGELLYAGGFVELERIDGEAPVVAPLRFRAVSP